jgi:hypothetical protein
MLLIGSRAILHHLPDFRPPVDWDLVGTEAEIARLHRVLLRSSKHAQQPDKAVFHHQGAMVEVINASRVPYWAKVEATFADGPVIDDPVLGPMRVPPVGFLLLTKQCGLIYRIYHWHKNLTDLYFMRDRVPSIPPEAAALLPDAVADSRRMFAERHVAREGDREPCHPALRGPLDPALHRALHARLRLGKVPAVDEPRAWEGMPELRGDARRQRMIDLFAEEAMVMGAELSLRPEGLGAASEAQLARWALRTLITCTMPEGLRYFGVNYYREIRDRMEPGWLGRATPPS